MLSSLLMAAFVAQASEEGFSKLQIFMQQLISIKGCPNITG